MDWSDITLKEIEQMDFCCDDNCPRECSYAGLVRELVFRLKQQSLPRAQAGFKRFQPHTNTTTTGEVNFVEKQFVGESDE